MTQEIPQSVIDAIRNDIQKELSKKVAGWAIAGGAGLVALATLGAWTLLKPTIASELGIVSQSDVERLIGQEINNLEFVSAEDIDTRIGEKTATFATQSDVAQLESAIPTETGVISLIEEKVGASGGITETRVHEIVSARVAPFEGFTEMKGAVVAFDRSEDRGTQSAVGACPQGWKLFREAGGRMLIGAGAHSNKGRSGETLQAYRAFEDDPDGATGGAETITLSEENIPEHTHTVIANADGEHSHNDNEGNVLKGVTRSKNGSPWIGATSDREWVSNETNIVSDNSGHVHNFTVNSPNRAVTAADSMPPYIALYFCRKEKNQ